jgi:hypothetical protein
MWSKNKPAMTQHEHDWVENIKAMACGVCGLPALLPDRPSEAHELEQGLWFTSIPLCADCHRGKRNGIHGEKRMWAVYKLDELKVLNETLRKVMT